MQIFQDMMATSIVGSVSGGIIFWNQILYWANKTLFPWIKKNIPELEHYVRYAFVAVDKVVTPIRNNIKALENLTIIKKAWEMLREHLLKVLVQFELNTRNEWVKRITYWVRSNLKSKQVVRTVVEELVDFDSLPVDVRKEWLKRGKTTQDIDVTQLRDRELELMMRECLPDDVRIVKEDVNEYSLPDDVREEWLKRRLGENEEIIDADSLPDEVREVLSNPTTEKSSVEIEQKSHIKGWVTNILLEEWRGELEALRYRWLNQDKSEFWIDIMTGFHLLTMFKAYLQIKIENKSLFKRKQG